MNILFVENHDVFAKTVVDLFLSVHDVDIFPSIAEAKIALIQHSYDLVLIDYDLDDGKGDELVRFISANLIDIKMIAVSAHELGNNTILKAGANAICPKLSFKNIMNVIDGVFTE